MDYLRQIGLEVPEVSTPASFTLRFGEELSGKDLACKGHVVTCATGSQRAVPALAADAFMQAFDEALASALTKFDSLEAYFMTGEYVLAVSNMLVQEMQQDPDFAPCLQLPERPAELQALVRKAVGKAYVEWKKSNGKAETVKQPNKGGTPLPWSSIDAYPEWVVGQVNNYVSAEPPDQQAARMSLEHALLEKTLVTASIKYDGTCFGKMNNGVLVGRRHMLGKDCQKYVQTSTVAAEHCDVAALRSHLARMLGLELGPVCVWGELMCNPGFYGYRDRGLAAKWLCFGVMVALGDASDTACPPDQLQRLAQSLAQQGFAHSVSPGGMHLRLLLCPALRQLLQEVAGCEVVEDEFPGLTHAELVAQAAANLRVGENEGVVVVFNRPDGQASLRKWKNSAEGGLVSAKHAKLLHKCHLSCVRLVSEGRLDIRVAEMVETMCSVAEAQTTVSKKGAKAT